ncbi:MAG: glycosyltransferase family 2 protein [Candidatus Coatesbacteria bacterium]|nr:MAG: glycosyltransferase family 2 protein [Candidatus Coatesbacteria bacterium]
MPSDKPSISTIIVSYRCAEALAETLESLAAQSYDGPTETVVVDNASGDGTPEVARGFRNVKLVESPENVGFAQANNLGIHETAGEFIFVLNPDVILPSELLAELADYLIEHPDVGAVGPTLTDSSGDLQKYCAWKDYTFIAAVGDAIGVSQGLLKRVFYIGCLYREQYYDSDPKNVFSLSGSCALIRRKTFDAAGGFDERYFLFGEDLDLFRTVRRKGFRVVYLPSGPAVHITGNSMGSFNPTVGAAGIESAVSYNRKYRGRLAGLLLLAAAYISLAMRFTFFRFVAALSPEMTAASRRVDYYKNVLRIVSGKALQE